MILLTGGTGFVGSRVLERLVAQKYPVRLFSRGSTDWQDSSLTELRRLGIDIIFGDLRDPRRLEQAVNGCTAIIHTAGIMFESKDATFQQIQVDAVKDLVKLAQDNEVKRFISISCLGASIQSDCAYLKSRAEGEAIVKAGNFYWTIFRPSFIFGEDSPILAKLAKALKPLPVLPIIGSGLNRLQPVFVDDVADCIAQSVYSKDAADKTYSLVGPKTYSLSEFLQTLSPARDGVKPTMNIPFSIAQGPAKLLEKFTQGAPVDTLKLMTSNSTDSPDVMQQSFKVSMKSVEEFLAENAHSDAT
jgi:NADH dehydrogenase